MSLPEVLPALAAQRDLIRGAAAAMDAALQDPQIRAAHPDLHVAGAGELRGLADEVDGQIRTAHRPFTIALVGEFSVGKSTFVNALLNLGTDVALSAKDDPDTACSVLLRGRAEGDPEARLHFLDGTSAEATWQRASGLASQVWLNEHPEDRATSERLMEIEYFVQSEVLAGIAINDLPGTGSRYWAHHSALTHRKMKEADAILWVVGEREPSAEAARDLRVLAECRQRVHPVVNVWEDPEAGIPRDEANVRRVVDMLKRNFSELFATEPICVSAKVVQLERAKPAPDKSVLRRAGWEDLVGIVDGLRGVSGEVGDRLRRVCGAGGALGSRSSEVLLAADKTLQAWISRLASASTAANARIDDVDGVHHDVRGRVRGLARERAIRISGQVAEAGRVFVEDTLQLDNFGDIGTALKWGGRAKLEVVLKDRFLEKYLKLKEKPNWLDELGKEYAEEVRMVVMPTWRQLLARLPGYAAGDATLQAPNIELSALGQSLVNAVYNVIARVLVIVAVGAGLAFIPGGAIIDAVGIVGLLILSAVSDPLAGARRRAVDRVRLQAEAQQHGIQNNLFDAGMDGNAVIEKAVRTALEAGGDQAERNLLTLRALASTLTEADESIRTCVQTFEHLLAGGK